jgi:hypothetical protein
MKKLFVLSITLLSFTFSNAQETSKLKKPVKKSSTAAASKVNGAGMVYVTETIDYGSVAIDSDGNRKFEFSNNGNKPLIITNASGSCGCTVPTFPKEPIMPGGKGVIGVKYDTSASRVGSFTKTVTITSNAEGIPTKVLTIKGTVLAGETQKS